MRFAFYLFIYKKVRISCVVQKLFVILQRFCNVPTMHLLVWWCVNGDECWGNGIEVKIFKDIFLKWVVSPFG